MGCPSSIWFVLDCPICWRTQWLAARDLSVCWRKSRLRGKEHGRGDQLCFHLQKLLSHLSKADPVLNSSLDNLSPTPWHLGLMLLTFANSQEGGIYQEKTGSCAPTGLHGWSPCFLTPCSENRTSGDRGQKRQKPASVGCDSREASVCYHGIHQGEKLWNIFKMQVHKLLMPGAAVALCNKILCLFSTVEYTYLSVPRERSLQCYPMNSLQMD